MTTIVSLDIGLRADTKRLQRDLNNSRRAVRHYASRVRRSLRQLAKYTTAAFTAITASTLAAAKAGVNYADNIAKQARNAQVTAQQFQVLSVFAKISATEQSILEQGIQRTTRALYDASRGGVAYTHAIRSLGLELNELVNKTPYDAFLEILQAGNRAAQEGTQGTIVRGGALGHLLSRAFRQGGSLTEFIATELPRIQKLLEVTGALISKDELLVVEALKDRFEELDAVIKNRFVKTLVKILPESERMKDVLISVGDAVEQTTIAFARAIRFLYDYRKQILAVAAAFVAYRSVLFLGTLIYNVTKLGGALFRLARAFSRVNRATLLLSGKIALLIVIATAVTGIFAGTIRELDAYIEFLKFSAGTIEATLNALFPFEKIRLNTKLALADLRLQWSQFIDFFTVASATVSPRGQSARNFTRRIEKESESRTERIKKEILALRQEYAELDKLDIGTRFQDLGERYNELIKRNLELSKRVAISGTEALGIPKLIEEIQDLFAGVSKYLDPETYFKDLDEYAKELEGGGVRPKLQTASSRFVDSLGTSVGRALSNYKFPLNFEQILTQQFSSNVATVFGKKLVEQFEADFIDRQVEFLNNIGAKTKDVDSVNGVIETYFELLSNPSFIENRSVDNLLAVVDQLFAGLDSLTKSAEQSFADLPEAIRERFEAASLVSRAETFVKNIQNEVATALQSGSLNIGRIIRQLLLQDLTQGLARAIVEPFRNILATAFKSLAGDKVLQDAMSFLFQSLIGAVKGFGGFLGIFHDGNVQVQREGFALLDKGEYVLTPDQLKARENSGSGLVVNNTFNVTGNVDEQTFDFLQRYAEEVSAMLAGRSRREGFA